MEHEITIFSQPQNTTTLQYVEEMVANALRQKDEYKEKYCKEISDKELDNSI